MLSLDANAAFLTSRFYT